MVSNELVCNIIEYLNDNINKEITINPKIVIYFSLLFANIDEVYTITKEQLNFAIINE